MKKCEAHRTAPPNPSFALYDLRVEISPKSQSIIGRHKIGDYFAMIGEDIFIPEKQGFSLYALAALLPLLPAKQRVTEETDWMTTDEDVADPDPHSKALYHITRTGKRRFWRSATTAVLLPSSHPCHESTPHYSRSSTVHREHSRSRKYPEKTSAPPRRP